MTLGVTGVVWLPRLATGNSTRLLGPGPVPLHVAGGAWGSVAAAFTDASATIAAVTAGLAAAWEGEAAARASAALARFDVWAVGTATKAAVLAVEAPAAGTKYGVALLAMPSLPEIAAVKAAKVAAASTGGVLNGSYEVAEAVDRALDIRAGAVMEGYELVSTHLFVKTRFDQPPAIVSRSGSGLGGFAADALATSPVQAAIGGLVAATQNPGVAAAASQIGSAAGSMAGTGVSTVAAAASDLGAAAMSGVPGSQGAVAPGPVGSGSPSVAPASTRPVSLTGGLSGFGSGSGSLGAGPLGGGSVSGLTGGGVGSSAAPITVGAAPGGEGALGQRGGGPVGSPAAGARSTEEDDEHRTPDYLKQFEHFADGRTVAPSVIGADPLFAAPTPTGSHTRAADVGIDLLGNDR